MTEKERLNLYVSPEAKEMFEAAVAEYYGQTDGYRSKAAELALREWSDRDRDARIEDKLDRVLEELGAPPSEEELERERDESNTTEKPKQGWPTGPVGNSLTAIDESLPKGTATESEIETAIEEHGGTAYKTQKKYWDLIDKNNVAMEIPDDSNEYATDPSTLATQCELREKVSVSAVRDVVKKYADYFGAELEHPEEWYLESVDDAYAEWNELKFDKAPDLDDSDWREETFGVREPRDLEGDEEEEGPSEAVETAVAEENENAPDGDVMDAREEIEALSRAVADGGNTEGDT